MHMRNAGFGRGKRNKVVLFKLFIMAIVFGICMFFLGTYLGKYVFGREDYDKEVEVINKNTEVSYTEEPVVITEKPVDITDWRLVLVNKNHFVIDGYIPELAMVENNYYFDARAVSFLKEMLADGRRAGLDFCICSAYRTIEKQTELYNNQVSGHLNDGMSYEEACELAATVVAYPGTSEHNLGLAVDIVARDYQLLDEHQAETAEAIWLKENCWKYGFILRYPLDKTEITGIIFEPWHYRYVGVEAAKEIMERGICLEEYLDIEE